MDEFAYEQQTGDGKNCACTRSRSPINMPSIKQYVAAIRSHQSFIDRQMILPTNFTAKIKDQMISISFWPILNFQLLQLRIALFSAAIVLTKNEK